MFSTNLLEHRRRRRKSSPFDLRRFSEYPSPTTTSVFFTSLHHLALQKDILSSRDQVQKTSTVRKNQILAGMYRDNERVVELL